MTIKLPPFTTLSETIKPGIDVGAFILCAAVGSRIGRTVFAASENAWTDAYIFGMVVALVFVSIVKRKIVSEKINSAKYPLWFFISTIVFSFLFCELFKAIHI